MRHSSHILMMIILFPFFPFDHLVDKFDAVSWSFTLEGRNETGEESRKAIPDSMATIGDQASYVTHRPCMFSVRLPADFIIRPMHSDKSPDYCDYAVKNRSGVQLIELHSMDKYRFDSIDIRDLYRAALQNSSYDITYKVQKGNWFVISGYNKQNGKIFYWKRVVGENFISDLDIEYAKSAKSMIEPHIGTIAKSFTSM